MLLAHFLFRPRFRYPLLRLGWFCLLALCLSSALSSCHERDNSLPVPGPDPGPQLTTTISGIVRDEQNQPVAGATVQVAGQTQVTGTDGTFRFHSAVVPVSRCVLHVRKLSYFDSVIGLKPNASYTSTTVLLTSRGTALSLSSAAAGGTLQVPGGARIELPADALTLSGSPYSGAVRAFVRYIDPTSPRVADLMPGRDLRGESADGKAQKLITYGAMRVELEDGAGHALQLATGKPATLHFPVAAAQRSGASATIPLWHFDEAKGLWLEEGAATLTGNEYVGTVQHFSDWNADKTQGNSAFIKFRIRPTVDMPGLLRQQAPYPIARVLIARLGAQYTVLCNARDSVHIVEVPAGSWRGPNGEADELYSVAADNYGTASVNRLPLGNLADGSVTDIGTLRVAPLSAVKGQFGPVACNGRPVASFAADYGVATANGDFLPFDNDVDSNGQFAFRCAPGQTLNLYFFDNQGDLKGQRTLTTPPAGQVIDLGVLDPCTGNPPTNGGTGGGVIINPGTGTHTVDPNARIDFTINGGGHVNQPMQLRDTSPAGPGPFATYFTSGAIIGLSNPALQLQAGGVGPGAKYVYLTLENATTTGTHPLTTALPAIVFNAGEPNQEAYFPLMPRPADGLAITITRYDAVGGRIQGSFCGKLMSLTGDTVTISNGSFDLRRGANM